MYNLDFYKIQALYNTQIRNVGLYLSISLALLGYSRYYRGKNDNIFILNGSRDIDSDASTGKPSIDKD